MHMSEAEFYHISARALGSSGTGNIGAVMASRGHHGTISYGLRVDRHGRSVCPSHLQALHLSKPGLRFVVRINKDVNFAQFCEILWQIQTIEIIMLLF